MCIPFLTAPRRRFRSRNAKSVRTWTCHPHGNEKPDLQRYFGTPPVSGNPAERSQRTAPPPSQGGVGGRMASGSLIGRAAKTPLPRREGLGEGQNHRASPVRESLLAPNSG